MKLINGQLYKLSDIPKGQCFLTEAGRLFMVTALTRDDERIPVISLRSGDVINFYEYLMVKYQSVQIRKIKPRAIKEKQTDTVKIIAR